MESRRAMVLEVDNDFFYDLPDLLEPLITKISDNGLNTCISGLSMYDFGIRYYAFAAGVAYGINHWVSFPWPGPVDIASYIPSEYHSMTVEFLRNQHTQKSTIGFGPYFSIVWIGPNTLLLQERQHGLEELYIRNTPIPYPLA